MDLDELTIATTSDCSEDRGPALDPDDDEHNNESSSSSSSRGRVRTMVEYITMGTFWFFILSCFLLLSMVVIWPIVSSSSSSSRPSNHGDGYNNNDGGGVVDDPNEQQIIQTELKDVQYFLEQEGYSLTATIYNTSSAQYKAAVFMMTQSLPSSSISGSSSNNNKQLLAWQQRYAVVCLYYSTGGEAVWKLDSYYYFFNNRYPVCDWGERIYDGNRVLPFGVFCDRNERVTSIIFFDNGLTGSLPEQELRLLLPHLEMLYLDYNPDLTDDMTSLIRGKLPPSLTDLGMIGCNIKGSIPTEISQFSSLQILSLGYNALTGSIPLNSSMPKQLEFLSIEENFFTGEIVKPLADLTKLEEVYMEDNDFEDVLTESSFLAGSVSKLSQLDISDNPKLRGEVPLHFPSLTVLDAHGTSLERIPEMSSKSSSRLEFLALHDNRNLVAGTFVPPANTTTTTFFFKSLTHLDLTSTGLTGDMPTLEGMTNLKYLFMAHTNFTAGTIPSQFAQLTRLVDLSLKDSQRTGTIPADWTNLTNLVLLDLDDNDLTGSIPEDLTSTSRNLHFLLLNRNRLNGTLPSFVPTKNLRLLLLNGNLFSGDVSSHFSSLTNLKYLYLQNNPFLTGTITTSQKCRQNLLWQADCATKQQLVVCPCCQCCDAEFDDADAVIVPSCDQDGDILLQYENPLWYHRYQRQEYTFSNSP
mmetsp:Transcript_21697/g.32923  ORF Transcript_21697/g.32923 Transcript_21697/m.32923 type:complete len:695 (-) Transcript_21697:32-2116(-)